MMVPGKMTPCQSREAVVTVLSYCNGIMDGFLQPPRLGSREKFCSLSQMLLLLDSLMDLEDCPKNPPSFISPAYGDSDSIAVFRIQILFREHYTWQGKLVWQNENQETVFHSAIELMEMLDEILGE